MNELKVQIWGLQLASHLGFDQTATSESFVRLRIAHNQISVEEVHPISSSSPHHNHSSQIKLRSLLGKYER